jgi:hypothetical protein
MKTVAWCKYFVPKISTPGISPDDPALNEHIMYAKCIKGHVLRDAADWILCENLPSPDSRCWQEGGETLFSLAARKGTRQNSAQATASAGSEPQPSRS